MTDGQAVICGNVAEDVAIDRMSELVSDQDLVIERVIYYPYFRFDGRCRVPTLFGSKPAAIMCLVDAVSGQGSTSDAFTVERLLLAEIELVGSVVTPIEAGRIAHRSVSHALSKKLRVIADFKLAFAAPVVVYKRFWIVGNGRVRAMVDSVNGGIHPLRVAHAGEIARVCQ